MFEVRGTIGGYELVRMLGRCQGMAGVVYLAIDKPSGRRIALKAIQSLPGTSLADDVAAERDGARLQQQLARRTRTVPAVFGFGHEEGVFYIAMEYVKGDDLDRRIGRGRRLAPEWAARIVRDVAACLAIAHSPTFEIDGKSRSIIHGDIKPGNIRLLSSGDVKLLDFGIAKPVTATRAFTFNSRLTIEYASPERLETSIVDAHADLWAAGVVLYEAIAGCRPWTGVGPGRAALERAMAAGVPIAPLGRSCPAALVRIVQKALARRLDDRYSTAVSLQEDLDAFLASCLRSAPAPRVDEARTRRTARSAPASAPAVAVLPPIPEARPVVVGARWSVRRMMRHPRVRLACAMVMAFLLLNEAVVRWRAGALAEGVTSREVSIDAAWHRYHAISSASFLPVVGAAPANRALRDALVEEAMHVVRAYAAAASPVVETHWVEASRSLTRALVLDPGNDSVRSLLSYCEGHVARINGEARLRRRQEEEATRLLTAAVTAFTEAARLNPDWPDPHLALARTYVYGLSDVDRASASLDRAGKLGHSIGARELVQVADGHLRRAEHTRYDESLRGTQDESTRLESAVADYERAIALYSRVGSAFADVNRNTIAARDGLQDVRTRLSAIARPPRGLRSWFFTSASR